jgi:hypothetical protein
VTSEVINRSVAEWRRMAREGTLSVEDQKAALASIRTERLAAGAVSVKSGEKKARVAKSKVEVNSDDLLKQLSM